MHEPTDPTDEPQEQTDAAERDRTRSDGLAAMAVLALTIAFIVAIVVFAIA
ncbi:hypothetical protein [Candidatus Poriferisodalis sp.]|uniref:hypothetical protein n=1 Tax=Candidatus Poriferisodalis sp. TaxID=3101277 RepID=UPI003B02BD0C